MAIVAITIIGSNARKSSIAIDWASLMKKKKIWNALKSEIFVLT